MTDTFPTLEGSARIASRIAWILAAIVLAAQLLPWLSVLDGRLAPVREDFAITRIERVGDVLRISGMADQQRRCRLHCLAAFAGHADDEPNARRLVVRRPHAFETTGAPGAPVAWGPVEIELQADMPGPDLWLRATEQCHHGWPTVSHYAAGQIYPPAGVPEAAPQ